MEFDKQIKIDESSRKKITSNINENYFVEAGAGSGKTTALVSRMVKLIEEGKDISHISAITFTKAAANEFYERFQNKLIEESLKDTEYKDRYVHALQNIDLAFMGTIDAFCNMIMSEHPNEGLIPSDSTIIDEETANELYKKEYANILNGYYNDDLTEEAKEFMRFHRFPEDAFVLTLNSLLRHRDCEMVVPPYIKVDTDTEYEDEIKTVRKIVKVLKDNPNFISSSNEDNAKVLRENFNNYSSYFYDSWEDNISNILFAYKQTFGKKDFRLFNDALVRNALEEGIDYFVEHQGRSHHYELNKEKLLLIFKELMDRQYAITLNLANDAKPRILEKLRKQGFLTFNDYLIYLRDTLRKDAVNGGKLIKHIYERHKYFLIDEFQDTDPIQAEIFFYLAAEDIKPNWKDCIPHKGSLFIVGDPKQSIYRFKNADVASYLNVEKMFKQPVGEVLHLYKNFRSTSDLKDWFNNTFEDLLIESDNQAKFEPMPNDIKEDIKTFSGVYKYDAENTDDQAEVKDIILKLYDNDKYQILDKRKDKNGNIEIVKRRIKWDDFMIITPTKGCIPKYTKEFRNSGIPCFVEGNINFEESKAFKSFMNFFAAVSNPSDNRYLYASLKSGLFNIKEKDITEAKKNGYYFNVLNDVTDLNISEELKYALRLLNQYAKEAKVLTSSSLFTKIINNVEAFKKQGTENMEYVYFALELLKEKENSKEIITHNDAITFFEKLLYESNNQERCPGLERNLNKVHIANLHKVKGLEKAVVILVHPKKNKKPGDFRLERLDTGNKGYLFKVSDGYITIIETDKYKDPHGEIENECTDAENKRLQYVGATRAKNVLIIANKLTKTGLAQSNPWYDLLEGSYKKLTDIKTLLATDSAKEKKPKITDYNLLSKNVFDENKDTLEKSKIKLFNPSKVIDDNQMDEIEEIDEKTQKQLYESSGDSLATVSGTMVHRLMEVIINSKNQCVRDELIEFVLNDEMVTGFEEYLNDFRLMLGKVYDVMNSGGFKQINGAASNILPILFKADNVYTEVPFTYKTKDNKLWNGIIDLIYEVDGKLHIIDWKTNKTDVGLDKHYRNQLDAYMEATKQLIGKDAEDALIYHIDIN